VTGSTVKFYPRTLFCVCVSYMLEGGGVREGRLLLLARDEERFLSRR